MPVQVHSDDRGEYRLFGLATGRYRVCAFPRSRFSNAPSEDGTLFVRTGHPGSLHESGASDVVLTTHDATGIDIRVQRSRAYSLSGSVRSASGGAVDGAIVVAHDVDERRGGGSARTGDGGFELRGLLPGRYLVTATVCQSREPERPIPGCEPEAGFAEVDVAGEMSGLVIAMSKPRTAAGRVVFEGAPAPPPGALNLVVQTRPPRRLSRAVPSRPPYATVEENLSFVLRDLYDVPLAVGVQGLPDGWAVKAVRSEGRDITDIAVDFRGIREDQPIEVVLTNRVARPVVRVTDEEGRPVKSFRTAVLPADPAKWNTASWFPAEEPVGEGGMRIGPLAPGDYLVAALRPADVLLVGQEPERITHVAPAAIRVTLTEGDTRTLDLQLARLPAEAR